MTWANPWAWLGLAALAVPIFVHMLGRRQARVLPFPTVRFLATSRLQPIRRTRIQDPLLLAVRLLVLGLAVAALAQPVFRTAASDRATGTLLSRVVLVDTSASMQRLRTPNGESALAAARVQAAELAGEAASAIVVESATPATSIDGAAAFLEGRAGLLEIAVLSDFQTGTLSGADLRSVPADIGIRLERIGVVPDPDPVEVVTRSRTSDRSAIAVLAEDRTTAAWTLRESTVDTTADPVLLTDGTSQAAALAGLRAGGETASVWGFDGGTPVVIVDPDYEGRQALLAQARPLDAPWMARVIAAVRSDAALRVTAIRDRSNSVLVSGDGNGEGAADPPVPAPAAVSPDSTFVAILSTPGERPVALAARVVLDDRDVLAFFMNVDAADLTTAALIQSIGQALASGAPVSELEPGFSTAAELARLQRVPVGRPAGANGMNESDGRWLWLAVLALLAVETVVRRRPRPTESGVSGVVG